MTAAREHAGASPIAERFAGGLTKALERQRDQIVAELVRRQDATTQALRDQLDEMRAELDEARAQADRADARANVLARETRRVRREAAGLRWWRLARWFDCRARWHEYFGAGR